MHGLRVRIAAEMLDRAEMAGEDPVRAQPLESAIVSLLAGFLHARRGDDDLRAFGASPFDGHAQADQLHEVEVQLVETEPQRHLHLAEGAEQRD